MPVIGTFAHCATSAHIVESPPGQMNETRWEHSACAHACAHRLWSAWARGQWVGRGRRTWKAALTLVGGGGWCARRLGRKKDAG
eukprot:scaffold130281_cov33-Tisochrysis_lutea.AAC.1